MKDKIGKTSFFPLSVRVAWSVCVGAAGASGGGGKTDSKFLRRADRSVGRAGGAGLREGGEEHVHLVSHRRAESSERTSRTAEEEEEDQERIGRTKIRPLQRAGNRKSRICSLLTYQFFTHKNYEFTNCPSWFFQYLTTVIPYDRSNGTPSVEDLQILTKSMFTPTINSACVCIVVHVWTCVSVCLCAVLHAMREDSETVPALLTDYILKGTDVWTCHLSLTVGLILCVFMFDCRLVLFCSRCVWTLALVWEQKTEVCWSVNRTYTRITELICLCGRIYIANRSGFFQNFFFVKIRVLI